MREVHFFCAGLRARSAECLQDQRAGRAGRPPCAIVRLDVVATAVLLARRLFLRRPRPHHRAHHRRRHGHVGVRGHGRRRGSGRSCGRRTDCRIRTRIRCGRRIRVRDDARSSRTRGGVRGRLEREGRAEHGAAREESDSLHGASLRWRPVSTAILGRLQPYQNNANDRPPRGRLSGSARRRAGRRRLPNWPAGACRDR